MKIDGKGPTRKTMLILKMGTRRGWDGVMRERLHKVNGLTGTKCNHSFFCHLKVIENSIVVCSSSSCCCWWEQCYCYFFKKKNPFRSHEIRNRDKSIKINGTFSSIKAENTVKNFRISLSMCVLRHPSLLTQIPLNLQLLLLLLPLFRCVAFHCVSMSSMSKITVLYTFNGKLHSLTHAHHSITSHRSATQNTQWRILRNWIVAWEFYC